MAGLVDQWVQQQTTAQETVIQGNRDVVKAQIAGIEAQIKGLEDSKKLIQENARGEIDNLNAEKERLNDELRIQQQLLDLSESIKQNIQDLILGPQSIDTSFQRLQRAQGIISGLFAQLQGATPEQKIGIGQQAQDLLNDLLSIGGEAFKQPSLESRDLFRSVIAQLEDLQDLVGPTRSIEEINASIEAIDQQIVDINTQMEASLASIDAQTDALRNQIDQLRDTIVDTQTIQTQIMGPAAEEAKAYYEFIRDEATKILDLRLQQLADLGIDNLGSLTTMEAIGVSQLEVLRQIRDQAFLATGAPPAGTTTTPSGFGGSANPVTTNPLGGAFIPAQHGFEGIVRQPTLFLAGEGHQPEFVNVTPLSRGRQGGGNVTLNFNFSGNVDKKSAKEFGQEFLRVIQSDREVRRALGMN
jgi:hypothetical protein